MLLTRSNGKQCAIIKMTVEFILYQYSLSGSLSNLTGAVTLHSLQLLPHAHHFLSPVICYLMKAIL